MDAIVSMTGRLGTEVETRISRNGKEYAKFRLATSKRFMRDGQWVDGDTTWVSVRCFRQLATNVIHSLHRGQPVVVVGHLRVESWVSETGVERMNTVLDALTVGHDLNWGITRYARLERAEPDRLEGPAEPREAMTAEEPPPSEDDDFDGVGALDEVEFGALEDQVGVSREPERVS